MGNVLLVFPRMERTSTQAHHRHDINDKTWALLEPHLPGRRGLWGGLAKDNRRFINAVFGFCERAHRGEICRSITEIGKTPIADFVVGGTAESGKSCWRQ
jgi:hypothetical protein